MHSDKRPRYVLSIYTVKKKAPSFWNRKAVVVDSWYLKRLGEGYVVLFIYLFFLVWFNLIAIG